MGPRYEDFKDALEANARRIDDAILQAQQRQAAFFQARIEEGGRAMSRRGRKRLERHVMRQMRREERRKHRGPAWAPAIVFATLGAMFLSMSLNRPGNGSLWWLAVGFILGAIAFVMRGRNQGGKVEEARIGQGAKSGEQALSKPQAKAQSESDRTDALCEKLLQEIRASSQALRQMVHRPEETVASLRQACHALRGREQSLRALVTAEDSRRLESERAELAKRISSELDDVVRQRLSAAVSSLDDQLRQRSNLVTAAARLEAERTRIHYALENLYTQVLSVKSADAGSTDVAGAGLRQSLGRLSDEVSAVAESLEAVNRADESLFAAISPVASEEASPKAAQREKS